MGSTSETKYDQIVAKLEDENFQGKVHELAIGPADFSSSFDEKLQAIARPIQNMQLQQIQ